jgi:hypothetical protein
MLLLTRFQIGLAHALRPARCAFLGARLLAGASLLAAPLANASGQTYGLHLNYSSVAEKGRIDCDTGPSVTDYGLDVQGAVRCRHWASLAPFFASEYVSQGGETFGSNYQGYLRASSTSYIQAGSFPGDFWGASTRVRAGWWEVVSVDPGPITPSFASFSMILHGGMAAGVSDVDLGTAMNSVTGYLSAYSGYNPSVTEMWTHQQVAGGTSGTVKETRIDKTLSVRLPVAADGQVYLNWFIDTYASSEAVRGYPAPGVSAVSSFQNSAALSSVRFYDQDGNEITSQVSYRFANGAVVVPLATVPEPGTWALLGTGLLGLGVVVRRRRAA